MFTNAFLTIALLTLGQAPRHAKPPHVFAYDPAAIEELNRLQAEKSKATAPEKEGVTAEVKKSTKPTQNPPSYVNISGNFGGVFYVTGVGNSASQTQTNLVNITTNRALTFSANSFKPLQHGNSSEGAMGSVTYSMSLYQGTSSHVGALIAGPVSGTDTGFNGQTLAVNLAQIPSGGNMVLRISRTLTMTGQATGAATLVGTGYIGVTIN